jgi:phage-related protein
MTWIKRKYLMYDIRASTISVRVSGADCNTRAVKSQLVQATSASSRNLREVLLGAHLERRQNNTAYLRHGRS